MGFIIVLPVLICLNILSNGASSSTLNTLNGQHLRVIWLRWSGNPKGLSGPLKAGVILEYLSARLHFTYEMVRVTENWLEPTEEKRHGLFNYLWDQVEFVPIISVSYEFRPKNQQISKDLQQADLLLQVVYPTFQRYKVIDITVIWTYDNLAFLMPVNDETANINAVVKPFQWPVWLGLGISIVCVIAFLTLMQRYLEYRSTLNQNSDDKSKNDGIQYLYVFGNLLSQGGPCISKRLPYRTVAGVWTLAAFVFVQAYTSTLFTYVITPINHPLINSIYDIAENPDINLMVKKAGTLDTIASNANNTGMYTKLRERLNSNPNSRCTLVSDCIKLVTPGSRNVFSDGNSYLKDAIREDFQKTGKCNFQIAKEGFLTTFATFALSKNSPFTKSINQGLLELIQTGIIDYWDLWFRPMTGKCLGNYKAAGFNKKPEEKHKPLSLKNLSGAFVVIAIGLNLSLLAFLCEIMFAITSKTPALPTMSQSVTARITN